MSPAILRKLHRWIGLGCALTVLLASGSGILHVVMTWTQSPPPRPVPGAGLSLASITVPPAALPLPADLVVSSLSLREIADTTWWQALTPAGPRYFRASDGVEDPTQDQAYVLAIARRHLGAIAQLAYTRRLDAYDREYLAIFRLLPVHRVDVADGRGTRLYVSTLTGSVARHTDDRRQFEANLFSLFHKYAFVPHKGLRDGLLVAFTALAFLASLAGIALFFATRRRAN
jgi:hypothetical protein